jgi:hypothetical protein
LTRRHIYKLFFKKFYFHQSIQYSYKVIKYCINSSSPEGVGTYFSGLQFHPKWDTFLPRITR